MIKTLFHFLKMQYMQEFFLIWHVDLKKKKSI